MTKPLYLLKFLLVSWNQISNHLMTSYLSLENVQQRLKYIKTSHSSASTIMSTPQPLAIRLLYGTALAVQGFDSIAFLLTSRLVIPNRAELAHPLTRFWMRTTGVSFLPFALACWLLRGYHIRHSQVGRVMGACFALSNVGSAALYLWSAAQVDEYTIRPLWYVVGWRVVWAVGALWGLVTA
ncbi:hypothetical protein BJX64DRAFT_264463, partial [Aspergillus heterothallicus]